MADEKALEELKEKVNRLVNSKFKGDWYKAFNHYAALNASASHVDRKDLLELLDDADVGNVFTRGAWADGIIKELDADGDSRISWEEFEPILKGSD